MQITKLERKPGVWRIRVERKDHLKQRLFEYHTVHGSVTDADAFIQKLELGKLIAVPHQPKNFEEYFEGWLQYRVNDKQIRPASAHSYRLFMRSVMELLGKVRLSDISKEMLNDLYRTLVKDRQPAYVKTTAVVLNMSLKEAFKDGLIERDPTVGVKMPTANRERKTTTLTQEQIRHLLEVCKTCETWGPVVRFALATGMRRGEICALQAQDVDLERSLILVRRGCTFYNNAFHLGQTKTISSNRSIAVPEELKTELAARIKDLKATDFVFASSEGSMLNPDTMTSGVRHFLKKHGLSQFTIHDLRHAHATYLLQQKMHIKAVSQRLGHSDIRITLGIYTHVLPGDDEVLAQSINRLF